MRFVLVESAHGDWWSCERKQRPPNLLITLLVFVVFIRFVFFFFRKTDAKYRQNEQIKAQYTMWAKQTMELECRRRRRRNLVCAVQSY